MPTSYRPYEPDQVMLLPAAPQDWLPAGHLAHFINDTVDTLDLKAFYARYEGGGSRNQPFHPAMMVKVLVYAYATGVFSSRKIERRLHEDLALRMLAAGNFPRHRTICDFRAFHLKELSDLFVQVVRLAREMGLVKLGTVAIDGTKVKANASRHKAMSYERMKQVEIELKAQIDALLARAKATDEAEVNEPELDLPAPSADATSGMRPRRLMSSNTRATAGEGQQIAKCRPSPLARPCASTSARIPLESMKETSDSSNTMGPCVSRIVSVSCSAVATSTSP